MAKEKSIKVNFIMNTLLQGSAYILPFLMSPYVSRILLPEGMGKVSFATSVLNYFTMIAMLGVPIYGIRACARVSKDKDELSQTAQEIFLINIIMSVVVYALLILSINYVPRFHQNARLLQFMSIMIAFNVINLDWVYKSIEEYTVIAGRSIAVRLAVFILVFLTIKEQKDYVLYGVLTVVASFGASVWNFLTIRKYISIRKIRPYCLKRHLKPIIIFFAMSVATTIYTNLDIVMLGMMTNDVQAGYYDAAVKIKNLLVAAVTSLGAVLLPRVSYYISAQRYIEFKHLCKRALNVVLLMVLPLGTYFVLFSRECILLFSGPAFDGASISMRVLTLTIIMIGITNITGIQMLVPLGREKWVLISEIAGALIDLIINAMLIPRYGALGAAVGTLAAEVLVLIVQVYAIRDYLFDIIQSVQWYKIVIAALGAGVLARICGYINIMVFMKLVVSFAVFGISYLIMLVISREHETIEIMKMVNNLIKSKEK